VSFTGMAGMVQLPVCTTYSFAGDPCRVHCSSLQDWSYLQGRGGGVQGGNIIISSGR